MKEQQAGDRMREQIASQDRIVKVGLAVYRDRGHVASCNDCESDGCCRQTVFVQFGEALPIAEQIHGSAEDTPEFRAKLKVEGIAMERASRDEWFNRDRLCMLHRGGPKGCSVYSVRPTPCRCYFVATPPEMCAPPAERKVASLNFNEIYEQNNAMCQMFHQELGLRESPFRLFVCSLPRAVWIWLESIDLANAGKPWLKFINHQPWPSERTIATWIQDAHEMIR